MTEQIVYKGPKPGSQIVGIEYFPDSCWKCASNIMTISGIVIPENIPTDWNNQNWRYYSHIPVRNLEQNIVNDINSWVSSTISVNGLFVTSIRWKTSRMYPEGYLAAECPKCQAIQGDFPVREARLGILSSPSPRGKTLFYSPIETLISIKQLGIIKEEWEVSQYSAESGWHDGMST